MPKLKINCLIIKQIEEGQFNSYAQLMDFINTKFIIDDKRIMTPPIKTFLKLAKDGVQIKLGGKIPKEKTKEEIEKQKLLQEKAKKQAQELKLSKHDKIVKKLKQKGINERGFEYVNEETKQIQDLKADYLVCPVHLFRMIPQLKKYCYQYKVKPKNPDGLIIEELATIFKQIQNEDGTGGVVNPVDWISAFITYCADDIQFPYPVYDFDYFFNRLFLSFKSAFEVDNDHNDEQSQQPKQPPNSNKPTKIDYSTKLIGVEFNTRRTDITKLDEDDDQGDKDAQRRVYKHYLQCDLSRPQLHTIESGIKERFKKKQLWRNFYAFDIKYTEEIINISELPKYLFVHTNRIGYPNAVEEWQIVPLKTNPKSTYQVKISRILDLYSLCDVSLRDKLDQGRYERNNLFYNYDQDIRYPQFLEELKEKNKYYNLYNDIQKKYLFFDSLLFKMDIYHQYYFDQVPDAKPTGEYRLIGLILQKGQYFNHNDPTGQFMVIVYKKGKTWLKFYKAQVETCTIDDATSTQFWGGEGKWTPVLIMYQQIFMKYMQLQPNPNPRNIQDVNDSENQN